MNKLEKSNTINMFRGGGAVYILSAGRASLLSNLL